MQLFYAKNGCKKQLIFEKRKHFENCQNWPPSIGYSLCKVLTLGQILKMQKNMRRTLLQDIAGVLCKKWLQKTANILKMRAFWKLPKIASKQRLELCKIITLGQKLKMQKNMLKTFLQHIAVVLCKKGSKKQLIFQKWEHFENCQKWPLSKGYSLCKILTLGQKLKMQKTC